MIVIPADEEGMMAAWTAIMDIAQAVRGRFPWTLVGGQMVYLHALEAGGEFQRPTKDADVLVDVRIRPGSPRDLAGVLRELGFELVGCSTSGAHRFEREPARVDVLAPDNLGARVDLTTTAPGQTVQVPGGSQALRRTQKVLVRHGDREAPVPRPSLLGAVVIKAAAMTRLPKDIGHERHKQDLALLLSLVPDPFLLADEVSAAERRLLRGASEELTADDAAWDGVAYADEALIALRVLSDQRVEG